MLFKLQSDDVIHSFWVPAFLFKMDVIPGQNNKFEITPTKIGTYAGRCAELCGKDHARMLFNVQVVDAPTNIRPTSTASGSRRTHCDRHAETRSTIVGSNLRVRRKGSIVVKWVTSTDHKTIGHLYLITSFVFFLSAA